MYTAEREERAESLGGGSGVGAVFEYKCNAPLFFCIKVWKECKTQTWTFISSSVYPPLSFLPFCHYCPPSGSSLVLCFNTFLCCKTGRLPFTDSTVLILLHSLLFFIPAGIYIYIYLCLSYFKPVRCFCLCVCFTCLHLWAPSIFQQENISRICSSVFFFFFSPFFLLLLLLLSVTVTSLWSTPPPLSLLTFFQILPCNLPLRAPVKDRQKHNAISPT